LKKSIATHLDEKRFNFKYRKVINYALIGSVILLQLVLGALLYNQLVRQPQLKQLEEDLHISIQAKYFSDLTKDNFITAQINLQNYMQTKDEMYLNKYNEALDSLNSNLQKFAHTANQSQLFTMYLEKHPADKLSIKNIGSKIDSLRLVEVPKPIEWKKKHLQLRGFKYKNIIDSISIQKSTSVDSIQRKGLFGRISDAIKGKVNVQKEKENVVLTLGKNGHVVSGELDDQLDELLASVNAHYQREFENYKKYYETQLSRAKQKENIFFEINNDLLIYSGALLDKYNTALMSFTNDARAHFQDQYESEKKWSELSIFGLIVLIVLISILIALVTRTTFAYEKSLVKAKKIIADNLQFKNRIVGMISHEIRAPLNIISLYSKGLRQQVADEEVKESLKTIEATSQTLSHMAQQILDYSKNQHNKLTLQPQSFILKNELEKVFSSLQPLVEANGNELQIFTSQIDVPKVYSDPVKLQQLFYNIVGNANKFTSQGIISIDVRTENIDQKGIRLLVKIKDNGTGIDEEDLEHIFDAYQQGAISEKVKQLGVGLGLNLCKEIVELYNGKIEVTSKKNVETVVSFYLNLPFADKASIQQVK